MGWGWDSMMGNSSYARENKVIGNHFHDTMQLLFDGGDLCKRTTLISPPHDSVGSVGSDSPVDAAQMSSAHAAQSHSWIIKRFSDVVARRHAGVTARL